MLVTVANETLYQLSYDPEQLPGKLSQNLLDARPNEPRTKSKVRESLASS